MNEESSVLGKTVVYPEQLDAKLLFPIPRQQKRDELGIEAKALPFKGEDIWNAYELSWLNASGKPIVALAEFRFHYDSPCLVESKSFKLYLNSFNQTRFESQQQVITQLTNDLTATSGSAVAVSLFDLDAAIVNKFSQLQGEDIDALDIEIKSYSYHPELLKDAVSTEVVTEILLSHLLKSNCLITGQPDWASIEIRYQGAKINREALLKYLISFRQHNEFHEQCVERIWCDIMRYCNPEKLSVYARYTRRGGLDINPFRSNFERSKGNLRLSRQ